MRTFTELAREYSELQAQIDELQAKKTELQKVFDLLRNVTLPDRLQEEDMRSFRIDGLGTVALYPVLQVKTLASDALQERLHDLGDESLIKPTVNPSTLRAYIKEGLESGRFSEMDWEDILDINGFLQARLTKR